ncbi:MAG TPA: hypothetical protein DCK87_08630 [Desulfotomaculum sp.]|nr:hypothetical protein [Desulfotomaculum sp.]
MTLQNKIPNFKTIEEARKFWEEHSLADFADELEETDDVQFVKRNNLIVSLDLERRDLGRLYHLARKKGATVNNLITLWVKERLAGK